MDQPHIDRKMREKLDLDKQSPASNVQSIKRELKGDTCISGGLTSPLIRGENVCAYEEDAKRISNVSFTKDQKKDVQFSDTGLKEDKTEDDRKKPDKKKPDKKKLLRLLGNVLVVVSFIFIIKKIIDYHVDFSVLLKPQNVLLVLVMTLVMSLVVIISTLPWNIIVNIMTGTSLPFLQVADVSTRANLMKYLPGNVMHIIGRNELAVRQGLAHAQVLTATVFDMLSSALIQLLLSFILYFSGAKEALSRYHISGVVLLILIAALAVFVLLMVIFRKKLHSYFDSLKRIMHIQSIPPLLLADGVYLIMAFVPAFVYLWTLVSIVGVTESVPIHLIIGAEILSSVIGFFTPGAPGGIGIREAVMTLLLADLLQQSSVLLALVIFRIVCILGDLAAFGIVRLMLVCKDRHDREEEKSPL